MSPTSVDFSLTIAEVAVEGLIAAKRIGRNPHGSIWRSHYDHARLWRFADCGSIETMAARLRSLTPQPRKCIVTGAPVAGLDPRAVGLAALKNRLWTLPKWPTVHKLDRGWFIIRPTPEAASEMWEDPRSRHEARDHGFGGHAR